MVLLQIIFVCNKLIAKIILRLKHYFGAIFFFCEMHFFLYIKNFSIYLMCMWKKINTGLSLKSYLPEIIAQFHLEYDRLNSKEITWLGWIWSFRSSFNRTLKDKITGRMQHHITFLKRQVYINVGGQLPWEIWFSEFSYKTHDTVLKFIYKLTVHYKTL